MDTDPTTPAGPAATRMIEQGVHALAALRLPGDAIGAGCAKLAWLRPLVVTG